MAIIPKYEIDPTLSALKKSVEDNADKSRRDYLGASMIGRECTRDIWFDINGYPKSGINAIGLMAAESGYYAEDVTAKRLRQIDGIELWTHDNNGEQYGWTYLEGKMRGHYDGVIQGILQAPKTLHVWEHKDKNHKMFAEFQNCKSKYGDKFTLKNWDKVYYAQAQVNMHFSNIDRHYLTVSYAGARDYDSCRTEYNPDDATYYIDRAVSILEAKEPPPRINEKPDFYLCRFCNFKDICRNDQDIKTISRSRTHKPF